MKSDKNHDIVSAFIADNTDNFIYIVDPNNFDMIHMNKKALDMYGNPSKAEWINKKCYEFLHNKTEPCEFCTNKYVTENQFYEWQYYHPRFKKTYLFKDKLVWLDEKLVKLQVATDISKLVLLETEVKNKLNEQSLLLNCIKMLHNSDSPDVSIKKLLNIVCEFFDGDRGMIIQISESGDIANSTHEWTSENTFSCKEEIKNLKMNDMKALFDKLGDKSAVYFSDIYTDFNDDEYMHSLLINNKCSSLICAPILDIKDSTIGTFSIDNPKKNTDMYWLLGSLSSFICDFLNKNKMIDMLNELSYYDVLTKIKNRNSYRKELKELDESNITSLGVAYVDISGLSVINEEKGTDFGDKVIKEMSNILTHVCGEKVYRVGGDEFVVLEKNITEEHFENKINEIKKLLKLQNEFKSSIGFTWNTNYKRDDEGFEYSADAEEDNYATILSKNLDKEIISGKYKVYLQPQINFKTNELDGAEALIRRIDSHGNIQSPASFVPFYEKEGMIYKIDLHVFDIICKLLNRWKKLKIANNFKMSINFSRATIMKKNIVNQLCDKCLQYNIDKSMFMIEITETISRTDAKMFSLIIQSFKKAGFCVSLDDFGSGYANLSSLIASDFDEIKIDMGLTKNIHLNNRTKALTKVALNLCNEFEDMISVAEGIESEQQFNILKSLNCNKGQGYFFSKPISIEDFEHKYFAIN